MKILLAEDDQDLGTILTEYFKIKGFEVQLAENGNHAYEMFHTFQPHLCVLDVMMPELDGFSLAQKIKLHNPDMPFIFLTAKSLKEDKLKGLKLGAADYITKPFDPEELVLRIQNILKRFKLSNEEIFTLSKTTLDCELLRLTCGDNVYKLTSTEVDLLKYLFQNKNRILDRNDILKEVWGDDDYFIGRSMDVFISRIRKYLSVDEDLNLRTIRGKGFIFEVGKVLV